MKKECNNCYFYNSTYCTELSKAKSYPECSFNSGYNKAQERIILSYYKEYNTDTSAGHPNNLG